jgi:hypothetical protein
LVFSWAQDPTNPTGFQMSKYPILLPDGLPTNLQDSDIAFQGVESLPTIVLDTNNNCLVDETKQPQLFDAIHICALIKNIKQMWETVLRKKLVPRWANGPLKIIFDYAQPEANAFYGPNQQAIIFKWFPDITTGEKIYTCRMFDVVSHEIMHFIIDCLHPQWINSTQVETLAIHEGIADINTLITLLNRHTMCEAIVWSCKGNLHVKTFFSDFSEQFGVGLLRKSDGLRNADDTVSMLHISQEPHDMSRVLVGVFYDVMSEFYEKEQKKGVVDANTKLSCTELTTMLFHVGQHMKQLMAFALLHAPEKDPKFSDIINLMIQAETTPEKVDIIKKYATAADILAPPTSIPAGVV